MGQASIEDLLNDEARKQMKSLTDTGKNISELKAGEKAEGFYLIKDFEVKKTTNRSEERRVGKSVDLGVHRGKGRNCKGQFNCENKRRGIGMERIEAA